MFLEILNDLLVNSSAFYVYFGLIIMTIGVSQLLMIRHNTQGTRANFSLQEARHARFDTDSFEKPLKSHELFIVWFVKSFKRIDKLDDDQEDASNSYFYESFKIRGGQQWKKTTYSQPYENTGF